MSLARVHRAAKARKVWKCGKCGATVNVGEPVLSFSVGFRGREQRRCDKPSCYPTRAERESSMVASVYDAMDGADFDSAETTDELQAVLEEVAEAMREVASGYESSEMFEKNYDLQDRAERLNGSADELSSWSPSEDEPSEDDKETWGEYETYEGAHDAWLDNARTEAVDAMEGSDIP